ncbi:WD40-repeat-containing domain protein [Chiua virens]|nr:WD40-repeat-containing domain protein [Chiua virens]
MATLVPPPKRQKVYHGVPEPEPDPIQPVSNIVVQFVNEHDATPIAPAVNLPANIARETLQLLVNQLRTKASSPVTKMTMTTTCPSRSMSSSPTTLQNPMHPLASSSQNPSKTDILSHPSQAFSEENILVVRCAPQSVFKAILPLYCVLLSPRPAHFLPQGLVTLTFGYGILIPRPHLIPSLAIPAGSSAVEWDPIERKLASGGHDGHVRLWHPKSGKPIGDAMKGHSKWVTSLAWEPVHISPASPRLASSSKDGTVRVWSSATRRLEYTLGGHTASVNVVKWGGGGIGGKGVLYTASSDRTVRVWDAQEGRQLMILKDHAHWVTTLALNTDFVLRTGPFDHTGKRPASDEEAQTQALKRYEALIAHTPELLISGF